MRAYRADSSRLLPSTSLKPPDSAVPPVPAVQPGDQNPSEILSGHKRVNQVRVLLVDDNREFLASAVRLLSGYPELEVVAVAFSAREAMDQIEVLLPDAVLMDIAMPEFDGLEATRLIKASPEGPKVIIWTLQVDARYQAAAVAAGADGFVVKSNLGKQLLPLIQHIFAQ